MTVLGLNAPKEVLLCTLLIFEGASPEETILQQKLRLSFPVVRVTDNMTLAIKPRQHQTLGHQSDLTADFRQTKDVWLLLDNEEKD